MYTIKNKITVLFKRSIIFGIALGVLANLSIASGAVSGTTTKNKVKAKDSHVMGEFYLVRMGSGYDSSSHTVTSGQSCLTNAYDQNNILVGNPTNIIDFKHEQSMSAVEKALNVDVSSKIGGDRFGGSVAAKFANDSKENAYSTNLLYLYQYSGKAVFRDLGTGIDALRPGVAQTLREHPTDFRTMCGNQYVEQMDAGSVLAVRLSLNFNSYSDKKRFDGKLDAKLGLANVATAIQTAASEANVHVELNISALQQGGEPQKLSEIFGKPDSSGIYPVLKCQSGTGKEGLDACNLMISNIMNYADTLKTQLTKPDGSIYLDRLYYTHPTVSSYASLNIRLEGMPNPSAEILATMEQLTSQYDKTVEDYNFVTHYLTVLSDKLDTSTRLQLKSTAEKLANQIHNVYLRPVYDVVDCYKGYVSERCLVIRDNVQRALTTYQLTPLQENIMSYLETNSYHGKLINYSGNDTPTSSDYKPSTQDCIFAPVSSPYDARYAVNCDGRWLQTADPDGIAITVGFLGNGLNVADLDYLSVSTNGGIYSQWIKYKDIYLKPDAFYPNDTFLGSGINVTAPQFSTSSANLRLVKSDKNQA